MIGGFNVMSNRHMKQIEDTFSLYELTSLVRQTIEQTFPDEYWLEAELSEARVAQNGHFYCEFIEKDSRGVNVIARARATAWARTYNILSPLFERATGEHLRAGMKVRVRVGVSFHEQYGFSLNIVDIDPSYTLGDMARRRREILSQLEADGILEDNKNLAFPSLTKHIAVVSSAGAAGYGDFCDQLLNNDYGLHFDIQLFPAVMQGSNVESTVLAALAAICDDAEHWDCVVIIRGGGATSDLSDFDTYALAAAVAQMPLPVVVGIGHERDETVLDYVAHTRVKTPTAAAVLLIDHGAEQLARLQQIATHLPRLSALAVERQLRRLEQQRQRLSQAARDTLHHVALRVQDTQTRLRHASQFYLQNIGHKLQSMDQRLSALDPQLLLRRGYSLTFTADGRLVRSASDLRPGMGIRTRLYEGEVTAEVTSVQLPPPDTHNH